jgi:acetate kinase
MGTRCGDLDPAVVLYIQNATGRGPKEMDKLFNKESGLLGMAGKSDVRAILEESAQGNERASLAMNVSHSPDHLAKLDVGATTFRSVDSEHSMPCPGRLHVSV